MPWQLSINSAFGHRMDLVSRGNYTGCMCARFVIGLVTINLRRQVALFNQAFPRHACHKVRRSRLSLKTAARPHCHYGSKTHKPSTRTSLCVTWQHIWHIGTLAYQDACVSTSFRCTMAHHQYCYKLWSRILMFGVCVQVCTAIYHPRHCSMHSFGFVLSRPPQVLL